MDNSKKLCFYYWLFLFNFKVLKLEQLRLFQIGDFMYKYDRGLLPPGYKGFFNLASEVHSHLTRNSVNYRSVFARSNTRQFSVKSIGATTWNKIPQEIRKSLTLFKNKLRTYLFDY